MRENVTFKSHAEELLNVLNWRRYKLNLFTHENTTFRKLLLPVLRHILPRHRPTFMIIGAEKGGTTSIYHYLDLHPKVVASKKKEINFFCADKNYAKGIDYYHKFFRLRIPLVGTTTFDTSPYYLTLGQLAAPRIFAYDSSIKIIALLRDPIIRAYSAWNMQRWYFNNRRVESWDNRQKIYSEDQLANFVRRNTSFGKDFVHDICEEIEILKDGRMVELPCLAAGRYASGLKCYFDQFPKRQLLILKSEDFFENLEETLSRIIDFVGLRPHDWSQEKLDPIHVGNYRDKISGKAESILRDFYSKEVLDLRELTGIEFEEF